MSGMYGTTVANAGDLFSRYPASMGIYVTLNGFGAAMAPAAIGIAANRVGIRWGFATLLIAGVLLVVSAAVSYTHLEQGYKILVDLAAQHHLDDIHGFTIGVAPVSYTHLDVYKRQVSGRRFRAPCGGHHRGVVGQQG